MKDIGLNLSKIKVLWNWAQEWFIFSTLWL